MAQIEIAPQTTTSEGKKGGSRMKRHRFLALLAVAGAVVLAGGVLALAEATQAGDSHRIVGSWFGRAVPIDPFCEPGTEGCIVPPEVIMTPTFFADGVFMGSDHLTFGAPRTPGHGTWVRAGRNMAEATMVILQGDPENRFIGAFRVRFLAMVTGRDRLEGYVNVHFFPFVDENGLAIIDPETGHPVPDPLTPLGPFITDPALCSPVDGCLALLQFDLRRVTPRVDS